MPFNSTTAFKVLLKCCLALLPFTGNGAAAVISGEAAQFKGYSIGIYIPADPITRLPKQLVQAQVNEEGTFHLELPEVSEPVLAWITLRRFEAPLYLQPGGRYHIVLTNANEEVLIRTWQRGELIYSFEIIGGDDVKAVDINERIATIDEAYYRFFRENAALFGTKAIRKALYNWQYEINASPNTSPFEQQYLHYTVAQMKLIAGFPKKEVYDSSFAQNIPQLHNPAWWNAFNTFYDKYFEQYSNRFGGKEMYNHLREGITLDSLHKMLDKDAFLSNPDIRELVLLNELYRASYLPTYPYIKVKAMLHSIRNNPEARYPELCDNILQKINQSGLGTDVSSLPLKPMAEHYQDKPTLILITAPWSTTAQKEVLQLQSLQDTYGEIFHIIEVSIEGRSADRIWPQLEAEQPAELMELLEVYRIPKCIWVNTEGKISKLDMPLPSEGLERFLYKLHSNWKQTQQIKVGQEAPR